ncbi:MAG: metal-binding protein [Flammeovirgaceae bacterium]|nr:metal-binding protein [Flammeovirgaceae bacterium]
MLRHTELGSQELKRYIKTGSIVIAGNKRLKIYGRLSCSSGKRMKKENRVFFNSKGEALRSRFRPCGNCMKTEYQQWIYSKQKQ